MVRTQWQTQFDKPFIIKCNNQGAFSHIKSIHNNHREDRVWTWNCRYVLKYTKWNHCKWTGYVNGWDARFNFKCPRNHVITGVQSYHDNHREDRRWSFLCCGAQNFYTKTCRNTGWINNWDGSFDFNVGSKVIVGFESVHRNDKE